MNSQPVTILLSTPIQVIRKFVNWVKPKNGKKQQLNNEFQNNCKIHAVVEWSAVVAAATKLKIYFIQKTKIIIIRLAHARPNVLLHIFFAHKRIPFELIVFTSADWWNVPLFLVHSICIHRNCVEFFSVCFVRLYFFLLLFISILFCWIFFAHSPLSHNRSQFHCQFPQVVEMSSLLEFANCRNPCELLAIMIYNL